MALISKAVLKRPGAALKGLHNTGTDDNSAQRRISAGCTFAERDHVRRNVPVIDRKWFSGAAHAGHYFICDEQHVMAAADFSNTLCVAVGRDSCAQCCTDDRFKDK